MSEEHTPDNSQKPQAPTQHGSSEPISRPSRRLSLSAPSDSSSHAEVSEQEQAARERMMRLAGMLPDSSDSTSTQSPADSTQASASDRPSLVGVNLMGSSGSSATPASASSLPLSPSSAPEPGPGSDGKSGLSIGMRPAGGPPPGSMNMAEMATRAAGRNSWHRRASKPVSWWMFAIVGVLLFQQFIPRQGWLLVHMVTLGLITNSILIWSQHFTEALLKVKLPDSARPVQVRRIFILNGGIVLLMAGMLSGLVPLTHLGALTVGVCVAWHGTELFKHLRNALPSRFGPTIRFYIMAAWMLPLGALFGALLAMPELSSEWHARLLLAHEAVNVLGFVGLTVFGTLITFWPTTLRTKMVPNSLPLNLRGLYTMCAGIVLLVAGALLGINLLAAAGLLVYLAGLSLPVYVMVRTVLAKAPVEFPPMSAGAAVCWFVVGVVWTLIMVATTPFRDLDMSTVTPVFVVGFLLQILLGAMSFLLPQRMGGGPSVVRGSNKEFSRFAAGRVAIVNTALLFYLAPFSSPAMRVAVAIVGALALASFIPLMVRGVKASVQGRKKLMEARARGEKPSFDAKAIHPDPIPHSRFALMGVLAVTAALVVGVAVNPAAVNFNLAAGTRASGEETRISIEANSNLRFSPDTVQVPAGNRLVVEVKNTDSMVHDLTFANGARTGSIDPGETRTVDVGVIGTDLEGWCSIAGHRELGMLFHVKVTGETSASGGSGHHGSVTATGNLLTASSANIDLHKAPGEGYAYRDPVLAPVPEGVQRNGKRVHQVTLDVQETQREVAPGLEMTAWTFNGAVMGPTLHGKIGDVFEITLVNNGTVGHSVDFHAGVVSPDNTMKTINPGEKLVYRFEAVASGIWLYHCSTMPMSLHLSAGMFGAVIIDPPNLDPVDREYVLVQNEVYLVDTNRRTDSGAVVGENSMQLINSGVPSLTMFNGHATQYSAAGKPLVAKTGERVRIWVLAAGPSKGTSFHVVGGQFDTVYKEGGYTLRGGVDPYGRNGGHSQALDLAPAQGGFVEMSFGEPGSYTFVNHSFAEAERGAEGVIKVTTP